MISDKSITYRFDNKKFSIGDRVECDNSTVFTNKIKTEPASIIGVIKSINSDGTFNILFNNEEIERKSVD